MTAPFHVRCRQKFLYEALYENTRAEQLDAVRLHRSDLVEDRSKATPNLHDQVVLQAFVYHEKFWLWMLDYTAGKTLEELAPRLTEIVDEFVEWHRLNVPFRQSLQTEFPDKNVDVTISPVDFDNQIWYGDALQFLSVALVLRDAASVKRIIRAMDSNRYLDALYDNLIAGYVEADAGRCTDLLHETPYGLLANCFDEPDDAKATQYVKDYLKAWYKAQRGARWYDGHLKVLNDTAPYYGYWAFEAAATCYFLNIDDSGIDHLVYPKDLVAYGRKLRAENRWTSDRDAPIDGSRRLRALHGEVVPESGLWTTPAIRGEAGQRRMVAGEQLPPTAMTDWGEVIWYLETK